MQPNYNNDYTKQTSRTLAQDDAEPIAPLAQYRVDVVNNENTKNSVIRRAPKIHKRNRARKVPYYLLKKKENQRVSALRIDKNIENHPKTVHPDDGRLAPSRYQDLGSN